MRWWKDLRRVRAPVDTPNLPLDFDRGLSHLKFLDFLVIGAVAPGSVREMLPMFRWTDRWLRLKGPQVGVAS